MPCKFDNDKKELFAYYILHNMTQGPSNMFTSPDKSLQIDTNLLTLKNQIDNALLEYKATKSGMKKEEIPKIKSAF